jgi:hypothetical protein
VFAFLATLLTSIGSPVKVGALYEENFLTEIQSTFESTVLPAGWSVLGDGVLSTTTAAAHSGSKSLKLTGRTKIWNSPVFNIYSSLKAGGAGTYFVSLWAKVDVLNTSPTSAKLLVRGTPADDNSFINPYSCSCCPSKSYYADLSSPVSLATGTWKQFTGVITVLEADIAAETGNFNLCLDAVGLGTNQNLYIDDVQLAKPATTVETWKSTDISFTSSYSNKELVTGSNSTFEDGGLNGWGAIVGGEISSSTTVAHSGSRSLKMRNRPYAYSSPSINIYNTIRNSGEGTYDISLWVYVDSLTTSPGDGRLVIRSDSDGQYSFTPSYLNWAIISNGYVSTPVNTWVQYKGSVTVTAADIAGTTGNFTLMIDQLVGDFNVQNLYIDDFTITGCPTMQYLTAAGADGTFEGPSTTGWTALLGGVISASSTVAHSGNYSLKLSSRAQTTWFSPTNNIYNLIKTNGAGTYKVSMWVYASDLSPSTTTGSLIVRSDTAGQYSFLLPGLSYGYLSDGISITAGQWTQFNGSLTVTTGDIANPTGNFNLMFDGMPGSSNQNIYIDDVKIYKEYSDPFMDVTLDVAFAGPDNTTIVLPAFWDGGNVWKVRFAPTAKGIWNYTTSCSNSSDTGLHGQKGIVGCVPYSGSLPIYQKGFVKAAGNSRYLTYNDGTPFFYIGDTHWTMPKEPYDTVFKPLVDKRVTQGFTVYQSEPLEADYFLSDGLTGADLEAFADMDNRFRYIADKGLVHANSQLFFTQELKDTTYSTEYLEKLSRYWVARYAAFPVLWTTAQEVDKDFHGTFSAATNPWKTVFNTVHTYDPYIHPQTGHQDGTNLVRASDSEFKNLAGYSWFASQWNPAKNQILDFNVPKNYWNNSGMKPAINYEGVYQNLGTNEFGARMQGWTAYLNGMFGHGYGAQDIWYYDTNLWEDTDGTDWGITVTSAEKQVLWTTSQDFAAATQLGTHMKSFFNSMNWWQLTPRFDDAGYFANNGSYYSVASILNDRYVAYFYNATTNTGTLKGMDNVSHTAKWFNPRTGAYTTIGTNLIPSSGQWLIPAKPDSNDWVLYMYQN